MWTRNGVIIGGASLWVIADHPEEELKGAWEFLKWLTEAEQLSTLVQEYRLFTLLRKHQWSLS